MARVEIILLDEQVEKLCKLNGADANEVDEYEVAEMVNRLIDESELEEEQEEE